MSVTLDVSGKTYRIRRDILSKAQLFDNMFTDCSMVEDIIVVDRSPRLFDHIYALLLDSRYPYPKKYYSELDYYGITYDFEKLYDPYVPFHKDILTIQNSESVIIDEMQKICNDIECIKSGQNTCKPFSRQPCRESSCSSKQSSCSGVKRSKCRV